MADLSPQEIETLEADYQAQRMSPPKRRVWEEVRQSYLGSRPPVPAPDVPVLPEQPEGTVQARIEIEPLQTGGVERLLAEDQEPEPSWPAAAREVWDTGRAMVNRVREQVPESKPSGDPRDTSSVYQQLKRRYLEGGMPVDPSFGTVTVPRTRTQSPGQRTDIDEMERRAYAWWARQGLEWAPTLVAMAFAPQTVPAGAYTRWAALLKEVGEPLKRAVMMYMGQNIAERVANVADPYHTTPPEDAAMGQAVGEFAGNLGGRVLDLSARGAGRAREAAFGITPWGQAHRDVITDLGEQVTPGMVSEKMWPRTLDVVTSHAPLTFRVSRRYERAQEALERELQQLRQDHPGTAVTTGGNALRAGIIAQSTPGLLERLPQILRTTFRERLDDVKKTIDTVYGDVDQVYFGAQIPWALSGARLTPWGLDDLMRHPELARLVDDPAHSIFGRTVQLMDNLEAMGPTVSLDTARDLGRTVDSFLEEAYTHLREIRDAAIPDVNRTLLTQSIEDRVIPALGKAKAQIEQAISPYLVDLRVAKEEADRLIKPYFETVPGQMAVAEPQVLEGITGRAGYTQDPLIANAMELSKQPNFVTFTEANQLRSKLLEVSRLPGPNLGNTTAKRSKQLAAKIGNAMDETGRIDPALLPRYRAAQGYYQDQAEVWNSDLIMENMGKNLDDLLTTMIKNERPNDFKTLRAALGQDEHGNDVFDYAAQMWLTRKIEQAKLKAGPARIVDEDDLLTSLNEMTAVAEKELFPRGLTDLRNELWQLKYMDEAVKVAEAGTDPLALQRIKTAMNSPGRWADVQSDVISHTLSGGVDPIKGGTMVERLNALAPVHEVLFSDPLWRELTHLAHTSRMVQETLGTHGWHWTPLMRFLDHGGVVLGLHMLGANPWQTGALLLSTAGLARLLTNQTVVRLLSEGMRTPVHSQRATEIMGAILGQIQAQSLQKEVQPLPTTPQRQPAPAGR